jgi:hypothetical protein
VVLFGENLKCKQPKIPFSKNIKNKNSGLEQDSPGI